jgi:hypothetical protein
MEDHKAPLIPLSDPEEDEEYKPQLTFGVEIEFVVATAPMNGADPEPELWGQIFEMHDRRHYTNERLVGAHMCKTLNKYGIPAELHSGKFAWKPKNSSAWVQKRDGTICAPEPGLLYEWAALEINSPALYFSEVALNQVRNVCIILNKECRINCNRSCGLHIHVGNEMTGFSYEVIRSLMATLYTFEPQLDTIHPFHRRNNSAQCASFRDSTNLAKHPRVKGDPRKELELLLSDDLKTFNRLKELTAPVITDEFSDAAKTRYHLGDPCALLEKDNDEGQKRTIEFRQHKSTLNCEAVVEWIEFCVRLVEFADDVSPEQLYPWLRDHISETAEQYSLTQVAFKIGTSKIAFLLPRRIEKDGAEEERRKGMGLDDAKCYSINQGMTDPAKSEGLTFTPILFPDHYPAPQVEEEHE